jgi:TrpR family trp operon transcriptional repressor
VEEAGDYLKLFCKQLAIAIQIIYCIIALLHKYMKDQKYIHELAEAFLSLESRLAMLNFFAGIFTPQELIEISHRLQIVKQLKHGRPQREIAEKLGVGIATVTRGSREMQKGKFDDIY